MGCVHQDKVFYYYFKLELNTGDQSFLYCSLYDGDQNKHHKDMYDWGHFRTYGDTLVLFVEKPGKSEDNSCDDTIGFRMEGNKLIALKELYPWRCMRFRTDVEETKSYFSQLDVFDKKTWKHVNKRIRKYKKKMRKKADRARR